MQNVIMKTVIKETQEFEKAKKLRLKTETKVFEEESLVKNVRPIL